MLSILLFLDDCNFGEVRYCRRTQTAYRTLRTWRSFNLILRVLILEFFNSVNDNTGFVWFGRKPFRCSLRSDLSRSLSLNFSWHYFSSTFRTLMARSDKLKATLSPTIKVPT